jgi:ATP-dependent DNA helicase DinG
VRSQPVRVAIDLETTGLYHEQDVIIEIGAVKFAGSEQLDTFESFVSINMPLPYRVQRLTGIRPEQLRSAPPLSALHKSLRDFLGDAPLVGHNIAFDVAFLQKVGLARRNPLIDTWELASLLMPDQPSYTLGALGDALRIPADVHHRALADAQLTRELFLRLLQRIEALDESLLRTLRDLPAAPEWTPRYFLRGGGSSHGPIERAFGHALTASFGDQLALKMGVNPEVLALAVAQDPTDVPDAPDAPDTQEEPEDIPAVVSPDLGTQPGADSLAREMLATLDDGGILLAEASSTECEATLAPIIRWLAERDDERLLIAVGTETQAARLARTVLPRALRQAGVTLPVAELLEPESYLCLHRWFGQARIASGPGFSREVTRGLARLTVWLQTTRTGARADVALSGPEHGAWERVRGGAEHADAISTCNYNRDGYCFFQRARTMARQARIVVTTHEALAAQLATSNEVIATCGRVLVLDANSFEENIRRARELRLDWRAITSMLDELAQQVDGKPGNGLLRQAADRIERPALRAWSDQVTQARQASNRLFTALRTLLREVHAQGGSGDQGQGHSEPQEQRVLRLDVRARQHEAWGDVAAAWRATDTRLAAVAKLARETVQAPTGGKGKQPFDGLAAELSAIAWRIDRLREIGARLLQEENARARMVVWLRLPYPQNHDRSDFGGRGNRNHRSQGQKSAAKPSGNGNADGTVPAETTNPGLTPASAAVEDAEPLPELHGEPLELGPLLQPLSAAGRSLVLAGPALAVAGDFETMRVGLGLPDGARQHSLTSDHSAQTLLCLPVDVAEPNAQHYQQRLNAALIGLATALEGRLVAIFSSHAALRSAWMGIRRELEQQNILVLAQGQDGSARQLWRTFETESRVVLLGAGSFWDGAARTTNPPACVVVTRLPFPALSDPPAAARAERWSDPQSGFVVPQGALRIRQALNGLAWSHSQRNAVVLFDRRIQTRGYGPTILGTLPRCEQYEESLARITERVAEWVNG